MAQCRAIALLSVIGLALVGDPGKAAARSHWTGSLLSESGRSAVLAIIVRSCQVVSHYQIGVCQGHYRCSGDACLSKRGRFYFNAMNDGELTPKPKRRDGLGCSFPGPRDASGRLYYYCFAANPTGGPGLLVDKGTITLNIPAQCQDFVC